jgi:hypothetical protein
METWSCFVYLVEPWDMASERLIKSLGSTEPTHHLLCVHLRPGLPGAPVTDTHATTPRAQERRRGGWNFTLNYRHHVYMHILYRAWHWRSNEIHVYFSITEGLTYCTYVLKMKYLQNFEKRLDM